MRLDWFPNWGMRAGDLVRRPAGGMPWGADRRVALGAGERPARSFNIGHHGSFHFAHSCLVHRSKNTVPPTRGRGRWQSIVCRGMQTRRPRSNRLLASSRLLKSSLVGPPFHSPDARPLLARRTAAFGRPTQNRAWVGSSVTVSGCSAARPVVRATSFPSGNCSTVACWLSRKRVTSTVSPFGNSSAS